LIHRRRFLAAASGFSAAALFSDGLAARQDGAGQGGTIRLRDGRRLGYTSFGDTHGWPVLYFHGIPTSRIEARFFEPAAIRCGCHLIAIDRPGFGTSDFKCGRRVVDWLDDVSEFVFSPQLPASWDLSQFSIACFSSGAAYALLCAAMLPPENLKSTGIVDGVAPLEKIRGDGGTAALFFRLAHRNPRLARSIYDLNTRQIRRRPDLVLRRTSRFFSSCDEGVFRDPGNAAILIDSYRECVRCGPAGVVHDMSLLSQPWGFCLEDIPQTVGLWYGACDITTPVASMGNCLNSALANSILTVYPGEGHLSMLNAAGDALFRHLLTAAGRHSKSAAGGTSAGRD
jgi:pimeloyl-ACP methyl ester carboxylesterase